MSEDKSKNDSPEMENADAAETPEEQNAQTWEEPVPELSETDKLKAELAAAQEKFLYLQAEYQNFRKRSARDISDVRAHAVVDTLTPFLSVADFLGMAQSAAEKSDNLDAIKQGLVMIIAQFDKALEEMSVRKFSAVGEKFDPELHDAVGREASDTVPDGVVIREWNCGYKIGEKLLRPARVLVSSGPVKAEEAPEAKE
ncbi:MAG: nucleotide exchange factor GrpE [Lentisphaerae bacterium]|nr:nucleotide exchange factor GrpE [Lentisphaerota bacterium]